LFLTQAFMEKSIVRASKRSGFAAVFACGGGGAADLELEPTHA
jgi:ferredoxin